MCVCVCVCVCDFILFYEISPSISPSRLSRLVEALTARSPAAAAAVTVIESVTLAVIHVNTYDVAIVANQGHQRITYIR